MACEDARELISLDVRAIRPPRLQLQALQRGVLGLQPAEVEARLLDVALRHSQVAVAELRSQGERVSAGLDRPRRRRPTVRVGAEGAIEDPAQ